MVSPAAILGKRILITGDVNSGKTTLTRQIMEVLCEAALSPRMVIVDCAPEIPQDVALARGISGVGGKLFPPHGTEALYLTTTIKAPRLSTSTEDEAVLVAGENRSRIDALFDDFSLSGRDILLINDITLYLHAGEALHLVDLISPAKTVVANGYRGARLGTGVLSQREARELEVLLRYFPYHVSLPGSTLEEILAP
jgi:hypothetical protein